MDDSSLYSILDDALDLLPEAWEDSSSDTAPASPLVLHTDEPPKSSGFSLPKRFHSPLHEGSPLHAESAPSTTNQWDPRLIMDLAVGVEGIDEILPRYNLTEDDFLALSENRVFKQDLGMAIRDVKENGLTFKTRARVQAEAYLEVLDGIIYADATPASTRLEAIKSTVRWGGLDEAAKTEESMNNTQINVNISF